MIGGVEAAMLAPVWTFSSHGAGAEGDFTGNPIVADGCVFAGSNRGWVFAMNADTGALVWKSKLPGDGGINSTVNVTRGRGDAAVSHGRPPPGFAPRAAAGRGGGGAPVTPNPPRPPPLGR